MLVTFRVYTPRGRAEQEYEVHSLFVGGAMRGQPDSIGRTTPVAIGRWLFEGGYLTLHSPDRTEDGDRWALTVGGERPLTSWLDSVRFAVPPSVHERDPEHDLIARGVGTWSPT